MSSRLFNENLQRQKDQQPLYTGNKPARTGTFIEGTDDLDPDPDVGLDAGYVNVRIDGNRAATRALNAINNSITDTPCIVGYNQAGTLVAHAVDFSEENVVQHGNSLAGLGTPDKTKQTNNTVVPGELLAGGRVMPSDLGGLYIFVEAYVPGGLDNGVNVDLSADEPGSANAHRWELIYLTSAGVPTVTALTEHAFASNAGLLVSEARAYALPANSIRLFAVSLSNGQTAINATTSRFVDLRRHHEREGGVLSVVAGTGVTVDNTDPANPIVSATAGGTNYIRIIDQKTQNTAGGTFISGAWRTRDLNTETDDTGGHASVASNQITLAAGTYRYRITVPAFLVDGHQGRLQDITNTATIRVGSSEVAGVADSVTSHSIISGRMVVTGSTVFEVQHQCQVTRATDGFGFAVNVAAETYTIAEFWKE